MSDRSAGHAGHAVFCGAAQDWDRPGMMAVARLPSPAGMARSRAAFAAVLSSTSLLSALLRQFESSRTSPIVSVPELQCARLMI
eukprot:2017-Hanusia_phi.AAC.1